MNFVKSKGFKSRDVRKFWLLINDCDTIGRVFNVCENVLVTLSVKDLEYRFIYFKSKSGKGVRVLDESGRYHAVLWNKTKEIGGKGDGEIGYQAFIDLLEIFTSAIVAGETKNKDAIELNAVESPYPHSEHVPLTPIEEAVLKLHGQGMNRGEIKEALSITGGKFRALKESLYHKGYNLYEEEELFEEVEMEYQKVG